MVKRKFRKHLSLKEIKKLFSNPFSLRKTVRNWKKAEKRGLKFVKFFKNLDKF